MQYGEGAARFSGATYDPASHYRAAAVFAFHVEQGLTAERLRENQPQADRLFATDVRIVGPRPRGRPRRANLRRAARRISRDSVCRAAALSRALRVGVLTDVRGDLLRLGPAPYLTDAQLRDAVNALHGLH